MGYVESLRQRIRDTTPKPPPPPWKTKGTQAIGGLTEIGFADSSELLLVVSTTGRGIFDALTGQRLARDAQSLSPDWYDPIKLTAKGIGPLEGMTVKIAGLSGGGLPLSTADEWRIQPLTPDWPEVFVILEPPGASVLTERLALGCVRLETTGAGDFRGCGFSTTGRSLVVATSADVQFFAR